MDAIQNYLEKNPQAVKKLLYKNQSYVFFRLLDLNEGPYGSLEVALTAGRSLAVDYRLFPKAALVYIATNKPNCEEDPECKSHTALKRFMHIQDTGGAIRTFGRADVFWGRGELAQKTAGYMQHLGDLFIDNRIDNLLGILSFQTNRDSINISVFFKQNSFTFHYRNCCFCSNIA